MPVQYDSIGVGASVKAEYNRICDERSFVIDDVRYEFARENALFVPWNAGAAVVEPYAHVVPDDLESALNRDFFGNMKAQAWWSIRSRFYKTWRAVTFGDIYPPDQLISLDGTMPMLNQLMKELAQPTRKPDAAGLKMIVDKKPAGTRSPNMADAVIQCYFPAPATGGEAYFGGYSG